MLNHILDSKEAQSFFADTNVRILKEESSLNAVHFININTNKKLTMWAEVDYSVGLGFSGIYIDEVKEESDNIPDDGNESW